MKYTEEEILKLIERLPLLKQEIQKAIIGQEEVIDQLLITFLAGGHALLEGVPGLAKTLMIRSLAKALDLKFNRVQFTPDLMPSDIIGTEILEEDKATKEHFFKFNKGPVFANVVLADEINRTPPKTQAALLEAMQEQSVTYGGKTYLLDKPFFILATQNPLEQAGTFPLPEAQLDRFLLYVVLGYPTEEEEIKILTGTTTNFVPTIEPVLSAKDIVLLQKVVRDVPISEELIQWTARLVRNTRPETTELDKVKELVRFGAGPRAGQAMILAAKARAVLHGRLAVTDLDIQQVTYPVLRHRMLLNFKAEAEGIIPDHITKHLLKTITIPKPV